MRKLEEHFCTFEQEEKLIDLGFDHHQKVYVTDRETNYIILRSQALDFFMDKGFCFNINKYMSGCLYEIKLGKNDFLVQSDFTPYPESESALIDKLIELEMEVQNG